MRSFSRLCLAAVVFLLAASTFARAADPIKPCTLLTPQAAAALYGGPLDPPRDMQIVCFFTGPHGDDSKGISVSLITGASMGGMNLRSMYDSLIPKEPGTVTEPVGGLGDKALLVTTDAGKTITLYILAHNNILEVAASSSPNPNIKSGLKDTAKQILAKF